MKKFEYLQKWACAAAVRALKTVAQAAISTIGTTALFSEVNWDIVFSTAILAGFLSILTSIAGLPEVPKDKGVSDNE